jgi:arsenate reductase
MLYKETQELMQSLEKEFDQIPEERQQILKRLSEAIEKSKQIYGHADIVVICTHNSRRSHLGQLALKAAALYYAIDGISTFSGGVEVDALNIRMALAFQRAGFKVNVMDKSKNPKYYIPLSDEDYQIDLYYSKVYSENYNPQENFIALLVCSSADTACPNVQGAFQRILLPYEDPKTFDDTENESNAYDETVRIVLREQLYTMNLLKSKFNDK